MQSSRQQCNQLDNIESEASGSRLNSDSVQTTRRPPTVTTLPRPSKKVMAPSTRLSAPNNHHNQHPRATPTAKKSTTDQTPHTNEGQEMPSSRGTGGGSGKYKHTSGDVPSCLPKLATCQDADSATNATTIARQQPLQPTSNDNASNKNHTKHHNPHTNPRQKQPSSIGEGGGLGKYKHANGDVPTCLPK